jgi:general secretion pathway protein B
MSYILDALNKSEQEKTETKTPGLNTVHQRVERPDSRTPQRWQIIVGVILTLNVAALAAWYFTSGDAADTEMTIQPPPRSSLPAITENTPAASRSQSQSVERQRPQSPTVVRQEPARDTRQVPQAMPIQRASATVSRTVTVDASTRLAAIRFSSHIFAADQALRMVVVDGQRMKEGDTLSGGIRLEQITEDGVIFQHNGTRYPIDVLSQWDN